MNLYNPGFFIMPQPLQNKMYYTIKSKPLVNQIVSIHKNQYHINGKLGQGSFGEVYAARRSPDGKQVAVKVVSLAKKDWGTANALGESFRTEVEMSRRLSKRSKHIVHIYDFDFDPNDGWSYFVMDLAQHDLEQGLRNKPSVSSTERKAIWRQLVSIANALHSHQIVHLDIKPANILVYPNNVIKLADLGIAQNAHQRRIGPTGTIPYTAPEVTMVPPDRMVSPSTRADIWSWGAILYRMTYTRDPDSNYTPPCYHPPANQHWSSDPQLLSVLRHTLIHNPFKRGDAKWLAEHPYTKTP